MFVRATARAAFRSVRRRVVFARPRASRLLRLVLISAVGMCLLLALTASARVGVGASAGGAHAKTAPPPFPLSVRQSSLGKLRGWIVGTATIVNTGSAPVRSTTGLLGLSRGSGGNATGVLTFSIPPLPPLSSRRVRFTTRLVRALPVGSGTYKVQICTDVYSQIQRFAQNTNCSPAARLAIATIGLPRPSGPVPKTIIRTGRASVSRSSTAALRFVSTVGRSTFECSLDGGPWLACSSPQSYTALVGGPHALDVRAMTPSGKEDPTPAHATWTVDTVHPAVTLRSPVSSITTNSHKPVFSGSGTSGSPMRTLTATVSASSWSVALTRLLADGTYAAQAAQSDRAGNTGVSAASTFTIDTTPPAQGSAGAVFRGATTSASKTYSIGGTVSGLSGTVVLQDNGGDDLSVRSNGAFTFATRLATGVAYNVTVKTSPSGQSCGVSRGKGTVASANVTSIAVTCTTLTPGRDNFNRANGGLGASWAAMSDGGLSIVSQQVVGTANALAGDIRVAESYGSDQYSQIAVTSTQLSGGQWVGPTVRSQNGGQDTYLGIYFWNSGSPQLRLYKRTAGTFTQLGTSYNSGPLPAGTTLTLSAVGSTISFQQNGITRIAVTDTTLTGGAPGLMTFGAATADNWAGGTTSMYSIGGTVSGLSGTVVLQDNGGDDLSVSGNGAFMFATLLPTGVAYNVTVKTSPSGQSCSVSGATGTVASANVTNVAVTCTTSMYSIGGTVSGLSGTVVLQDNGGDDLSVSGNGAFMFATLLPTGVAYNVTVKASPSGQSCSVSGATGTVASANVTNVAVTCTTSMYSIGGTVSGLSGTVVLQDNGGDDLSVSGNGAFMFATLLPTGVAYNVTVKASPSGQSCSVSGATGTVASANVTNVAVTCTTSMYSIGGTVSGLSGTVVLQDNGGDDLSVSGNGAFMFATLLPTGVAYNVTVKTSPSGQSCSVSGATGTVASANVTNVAVTCTSITSSASDDFNRANGGLGAGWAAMSDGGLSIVSQQVVGTANALAGDIRVAESYGSDQYSQIAVTSTQLSGGQWVGPTVRSQNGGQNTYLGIYFWNNGTPQLRLYKRTAGTFTQLGTSYNSGPLPAGTTLTLSAVGSTHRLPAERHHTDRRHRHHADRRRPRRDDLRHRHRRQLDRRHRKPPAAAKHVLDRRHGVWVVGHGGVAGQRRR